MRRRLYFLLPDVVSARRTAADLLLARVEHRHMHVLAKRGTDLTELHEANPLQKTDFVHGAERGIVIGGIGGIALGVLAVLAPPGGAALQWVTVLATGIVGALLGAWLGSLAGTGAPNSRLKRYDREFEAGKGPAHGRRAVRARRRDPQSRAPAAPGSERRHGGADDAGLPVDDSFRSNAPNLRRSRGARSAVRSELTRSTSVRQARALRDAIPAPYAAAIADKGRALQEAPHGASFFSAFHPSGTHRRRRRTPRLRSPSSSRECRGSAGDAGSASTPAPPARRSARPHARRGARSTPRPRARASRARPRRRASSP